MFKNVRETIDKSEIKEELMVKNVKDTTEMKAEQAAMNKSMMSIDTRSVGQ